MTKQWVIRAGLSALSLVTFAPNLVSMAGQSAIVAPQSSPGGVTGQSTTRLPDGRWLLLGGKSAAGTTRDAAIADPTTGTLIRLDGLMTIPRAGHTATGIPDGTL